LSGWSEDSNRALGKSLAAARILRYGAHRWLKVLLAEEELHDGDT
jgi:hypothetical protein